MAEATSKFRGRFEVRLDEKGRFSLPSVWREDVASGNAFCVTNSFFHKKPCLDLMIQSSWTSLESRLAQLPQLRPEVQVFNRFYLSAGHHLSLDSHGRLMVPPSLRRFGRLEEDLILIGMGDKIEIWHPPLWEEITLNISEDFESILEKVSGAGGVL